MIRTITLEQGQDNCPVCSSYPRPPVRLVPLQRGISMRCPKCGLNGLINRKVVGVAEQAEKRFGHVSRSFGR